MIITLTAAGFHPSFYMIIAMVMRLTTYYILDKHVREIVSETTEKIFYTKINSLFRIVEMKLRLLKAKSDSQKEAIKRFVNHKYSMKLNGKELSYA